MGINEKKMQIVIDNYFKQECDVNTSIREAFEKGFRIGVKKASSAQPGWIPCGERLPEKDGKYYVTQHRYGAYDPNMTGIYVCDTDYIFYSVRHSRWLKDMNCKIIAWMPLPKPFGDKT